MDIHIPKPCGESLDNMTPVSGGYHCGSCSHMVIDFRNWDEVAIKDYFKNNAAQRICGIFHKNQLEKSMEPMIMVPEVNIHALSFRQQFLYALLICFGVTLFSCGIENKRGVMMGEPLMDTLLTDTLAEKSEDEPTQITKESSPVFYTVGLVEYHLDSCSSGVFPPPLDYRLGEVFDVDSLDNDRNMESEDIVIPLGVNEIQPRFPGGEVALARFLKKNLVYPPYERAVGKEGTVHVKFKILTNGTVSNAEIQKNTESTPNFDAEVLRVIGLMPKWKPGTLGGENIETWCFLPVKFKI